MENKREIGITLVALVITIILLLILAGITISQLTGSGLFENSKLAKEKYENERQKEESILADFENKIVDGARSDDYSKLEKKIQDLQEEVNALRASQTSGNFVVLDKNNVIKATTECTAGTEYTYTATQDCAIQYSYYFKLADGGAATCEVDGIRIGSIYCSSSSSSQYFENVGIVYLKTGQAFKIKSINYRGAYTVYGLK